MAKLPYITTVTDLSSIILRPPAVDCPQLDAFRVKEFQENRRISHRGFGEIIARKGREVKVSREGEVRGFTLGTRPRESNPVFSYLFVTFV